MFFLNIYYFYIKTFDFEMKVTVILTYILPYT